MENAYWDVEGFSIFGMVIVNYSNYRKVGYIIRMIFQPKFFQK